MIILTLSKITPSKVSLSKSVYTFNRGMVERLSSHGYCALCFLGLILYTYYLFVIYIYKS